MAALESARVEAPTSTPSMSDARGTTSTPSTRRNKILNQGPAEFNKIGGVEVATEMPDDIKFEVPIPAKVMGRWGRRVRHHRLRGRDEGRLRQLGHGQRRPDSMGYEDYYAGFEDAPEWVTVEPAIGKLDRRGGARRR